MIMSLVAIAVVGILGYVGVIRGFFSSLIHLFCVIAAAAIAFGVWEPLAYLLIDKAGTSLTDSAWAIALLGCFAVSLALLRFSTDKLLPANVIVADPVNITGGALCGGASGIITAGILVIGVGTLRVDSDFMGYQRLQYDATGSLVRRDKLLLPVDSIVASLFSSLSTTTLRTSTPMATHQPNPADFGPALRLRDEGSTRLTLRPKDFAFAGRYTVARAKPADAKELMRDAYGAANAKDIMSLTGEPVRQGYLEGFVVNFNSGARDNKAGQISVGNGQIRLTARTPDGSVRSYHPVAMVSQAKGDSLVLGRWRFDAQKVFIASVGGASSAPMSFEFMLPPQSEPVHLFVKGIRVDVASVKSNADFADSDERDAAIETRELFGIASGNTEDPTGGLLVDAASTASGVAISNKLPFALMRGTTKGLVVDDSGKTNLITDGEQKFLNAQLKDRGMDRALRVETFSVTTDTNIVQLDVGARSPLSILSDAASAADPTQAPILVDTLGQQYEAIGFIYRDREITHIRFTPSRPVRALNEDGMPSLSRSRPEQSLKLIFRCSFNVQIKSFRIGNVQVAEFEPPIALISRQAR